MASSEPGFKKMPVPGHDDLRPSQRDPKQWTLGKGRELLKYAQPHMMVANYGGPSDEVAQAPAKATWTPGMPGEPKERPLDKRLLTIQPGIPRIK